MSDAESKLEYARAVHGVLTKKQEELVLKHGTVLQFAVASYKAVPDFISHDEAEAAIMKYRNEFREAGKL